MARPTQLNPTEQDALVKQIGLALLRAAPADWTAVEVAFRALGRYTEVSGRVSFADDRSAEMPISPEVAGLFVRLRAGMYREGRGTWFNARYQLDRPSAYNLEYDRDEPQWSVPPPPPAYADEMRMFPRDEENVPEWLTHRLAALKPPFRTARIFDGMGPGGRPVVSRPPLEDDEREQVLRYLDTAPLAGPARGFDVDHLDEERRPAVPVAFHTDGAWIWPAAVNFYLRNHGVPPDPDLVDHLRRAEFQVPEVDEQARAAAAAFLGWTPRRPNGRPTPPPGAVPPPPEAAGQPPAQEFGGRQAEFAGQGPEFAGQPPAAQFAGRPQAPEFAGQEPGPAGRPPAQGFAGQEPGFAGQQPAPDFAEQGPAQGFAGQEPGFAGHQPAQDFTGPDSGFADQRPAQDFAEQEPAQGFAGQGPEFADQRPAQDFADQPPAGGFAERGPEFADHTPDFADQPPAQGFAERGPEFGGRRQAQEFADHEPGFGDQSPDQGFAGQEPEFAPGRFDAPVADAPDPRADTPAAEFDTSPEPTAAQAEEPIEDAGDPEGEHHRGGAHADPDPQGPGIPYADDRSEEDEQDPEDDEHGSPSGPPAAALPSQGAPPEVVDHLRDRLRELAVPESHYRIGAPEGPAWTMEQIGEGWRVGWFDGRFVAPAVFEDVADASAFLLGKVLLDAPAEQPIPRDPGPGTVRASLAELEEDDDEYDHRPRHQPTPPAEQSHPEYGAPASEPDSFDSHRYDLAEHRDDAEGADYGAHSAQPYDQDPALSGAEPAEAFDPGAREPFRPARSLPSGDDLFRPNRPVEPAEDLFQPARPAHGEPFRSGIAEEPHQGRAPGDPADEGGFAQQTHGGFTPEGAGHGDFAPADDASRSGFTPEGAPPRDDSTDAPHGVFTPAPQGDHAHSDFTPSGDAPQGSFGGFTPSGDAPRGDFAQPAHDGFTPAGGTPQGDFTQPGHGDFAPAGDAPRGDFTQPAHSGFTPAGGTPQEDFAHSGHGDFAPAGGAPQGGFAQAGHGSFTPAGGAPQEGFAQPGHGDFAPAGGLHQGDSPHPPGEAHQGDHPRQGGFAPSGGAPRGGFAPGAPVGAPQGGFAPVDQPHVEPAPTVAAPVPVFDDEDEFAQRRPEPRPSPRKPEPAQASLRKPQDWPIQPLPGEPPLTLFRGKQLVELPPGTEIDRYGDPTGNLTYAAGTPFERRSLVPDWVNRPYHAYRVVQATEALTGVAIPWFDQPGGGNAYVLAHSLADLVENGYLVEVLDREPPSAHA